LSFFWSFEHLDSGFRSGNPGGGRMRATSGGARFNASINVTRWSFFSEREYRFKA
jgi:hypothetical protein